MASNAAEPNADDGKEVQLRQDFKRQDPEPLELYKDDEGTIIKHNEDGLQMLISMPTRTDKSVWVPKDTAFFRVLHPHDDFPLRVTHDFTDPNNANIFFRKGDLGKIFAHSPDGKIVRVTIPRYDHPVHIPKSYLEIGTERIRPGDRTMQFATAPNALHGPPTPDVQDDQP
ncbi:Hypothetical predicted protein [Lecanosticta acicola]|uniref:Uncharacterized protein n=1 Tax=Lecanosticta acicola TaxID=111012 RepID=A0AAI8YSV7_9PEZI|nr:Hypothetical predicted protein [Lecanosticta acicola]